MGSIISTVSSSSGSTSGSLNIDKLVGVRLNKLVVGASTCFGRGHLCDVDCSIASWRCLDVLLNLRLGLVLDGEFAVVVVVFVGLITAGAAVVGRAALPDRKLPLCQKIVGGVCGNK